MDEITFLDISGVTRKGRLESTTKKLNTRLDEYEVLRYNVRTIPDNEFRQISPKDVVDDSTRSIVATYPFTDEELHEFIHHQWGFNSKLAKMLVDECYRHLKEK